MGTSFSPHTHLQEVPVFLLSHLFHWLSLHPPSGGNRSLRYEQHLWEVCSFPEDACGAKCWLYNFFMLVSDESVWIRNSPLAGRKKLGFGRYPKGQVAALLPSLSLLLCQNAIDNWIWFLNQVLVCPETHQEWSSCRSVGLSGAHLFNFLL